MLSLASKMGQSRRCGAAESGVLRPVVRVRPHPSRSAVVELRLADHTGPGPAAAAHDLAGVGFAALLRGIAQVIAGDASIRFPEWYIGIDKVLIAGLPVPVVIFLVASIALGLVLGTTIFGRQIYQIGTNEVAAQHAGIRTRRIKTALFVAMGFTSSIAGLIFTSRLGSVRYDLGLGGELQMVLMAMLGGTYIFGGRGSILGTFLAAWLLSVISTGMTTANLLPATQLCVLGVLLIISIIATNFIYSRTQR